MLPGVARGSHPNSAYAPHGLKGATTDWCTLTVLDEKTIEYVGANVSKGDPIFAEARVANSTYERNGQKVYSTDLIVSLLNRFDPANNEFSTLVP